MNATILFNFQVDKVNKKINVERSFNGPIDPVWSAWTEAEILDQWWAPKPWRAETKSMNFKEGGRWHYCMVVLITNVTGASSTTRRSYPKKVTRVSMPSAMRTA